MSDRNAFEKWAKTKGRFKPDDFFISCDGRYAGDQLQASFNGWQASRQAIEDEAYAWRTEDYRNDKSATTYSKEVADRWVDKGWPVWPLYTHPANADKQAVSMPEWVKCSEHLPSTRGVFLVRMNSVIHDGPKYAVTDFGEYGFERSKVTHWMPLPDPPKKGA